MYVKRKRTQHIIPANMYQFSARKIESGKYRQYIAAIWPYSHYAFSLTLLSQTNVNCQKQQQQNKFEPGHSKAKMTGAPSKDSDQPIRHIRAVWPVFAGALWITKYPKLRRAESEDADQTALCHFIGFLRPG